MSGLGRGNTVEGEALGLGRGSCVPPCDGSTGAGGLGNKGDHETHLREAGMSSIMRLGHRRLWPVHRVQGPGGREEGLPLHPGPLGVPVSVGRGHSSGEAQCGGRALPGS